jgi:L-ascorbate metabolism protein UlaG (beta-lactamase superfamily)
MKVTFIGHASLLIEVGGVTILSDPWWRGPCFGAQWWNYPPPHLQAIEGRSLDYVYISHGHHDHFHPGTLRTLNGKPKFLVSRKTNLSPPIKELGFDAIDLDDDQALTLAGTAVTCRIIETHAKDTLMTVTDGKEVCINLNDALHSAPYSVQTDFVARLKRLHPAIDYVFCGYGVASHFPNCYVIPGKHREATAVQRQRYFNRQWANLIAELAPRFGFPFAADVAFFEDDLFWVNEPTHNSERPVEAFRELYPESSVRTVDIAPGFVIQDGTVASEVLRQPVVARDLRVAFAELVERANRVSGVDEASVEEVLALMQRNLDTCGEYLRSYEGDYRFLIQLRNSPLGIQIEKRGQALRLTLVRGEMQRAASYDVIYTTRLPYLRWAFTMPHGDEILFVGSGGIFEYTDRLKARQNLHRELVVLLRKRDTPPQPRYGGSSKLSYKVKQVVKRLIGQASKDLYDLDTWTVFDDS